MFSFDVPSLRAAHSALCTPPPSLSLTTALSPISVCLHLFLAISLSLFSASHSIMRFNHRIKAAAAQLVVATAAAAAAACVALVCHVQIVLATVAASAAPSAAVVVAVAVVAAMAAIIIF